MNEKLEAINKRNADMISRMVGTFHRIEELLQREQIRASQANSSLSETERAILNLVRSSFR